MSLKSHASPQPARATPVFPVPTACLGAQEEGKRQPPFATPLLRFWLLKHVLSAACQAPMGSW